MTNVFNYMPQMGIMRERITDFEAQFEAEFGFKITLNTNCADFTIAIDAITKVVSDCLSIPMNQLLTKREKQYVIDAKKIAMYLCKKNIQDVPLKAIAEYFGYADHTGIIHNIQSVKDLIAASDIPIQLLLNKCETELIKRM